MIKPHIKVIQRNGVDVFITSSLVDKETRISSLSNADMQRYLGRLNHATDNYRAKIHAQYTGMRSAHGGAFS